MVVEQGWRAILLYLRLGLSWKASHTRCDQGELLPYVFYSSHDYCILSWWCTSNLLYVHISRHRVTFTPNSHFLGQKSHEIIGFYVSNFCWLVIIKWNLHSSSIGLHFGSNNVRPIKPNAGCVKLGLKTAGFVLFTYKETNSRFSTFLCLASKALTIAKIVDKSNNLQDLSFILVPEVKEMKLDHVN